MNYQTKSSFLEINRSAWHIPRASLSGSTSSTSAHSNKSHSNASSVKYPSRTRRSTGHKNRGYLSDGDDRLTKDIAQHPSGTTKFDEVGGVKRSSQSSQGSTDSNHSSHSASSGSMLLTAANLEQLAQIHKKNATNHQHPIIEQMTTYNANITSAAAAAVAAGSDAPSTIIPIDQLMIQQHHRLQGKTKDVDTVSLASSTHFTMVNGVGGPQRKTKSGICDRGHQITVLILTMSMVFFIGICGAVFLLELRAQKMPH